MTRIDIVDVVADTLDRLSAKDGTPLHHLVAAWLANPPYDWQRPFLPPSVAESIGNYLSVQLARVLWARLSVMASDAKF